MRNSLEIEKLKKALDEADAVLLGAGAGLSTAAGSEYSGPRFERYFSEFREKYGIEDMYSGGFYPYDTLEEYWAYWSVMVMVNRYMDDAFPLYKEVMDLIRDKDYFVLTTNVDHQFQKAGVDKSRLFYTQGDYGLFQCSRACHKKTYDNESLIKAMYQEQKNLKAPSYLLPKCPVCGAPMDMNLRKDNLFVEDEGWHKAKDNYLSFLENHKKGKVLYLELGVGYNTPVIIKYPFWKMTYENKEATFASLNLGDLYVPKEIEKRSILIRGDIAETIGSLRKLY